MANALRRLRSFAKAIDRDWSDYMARMPLAELHECARRAFSGMTQERFALEMRRCAQSDEAIERLKEIVYGASDDKEGSKE
jgi:hypothetical protein